MSVPGAGPRGRRLSGRCRARRDAEGRRDGEGRAPRGASRSSRPKPRREDPRPSLASPLDPSWHFRNFCKDALRFRGKGTAGAGALFAGIILKVFGQYGDTARLRRAAGCRGASTRKSHKITLFPCLGHVGRSGAP